MTEAGFTALRQQDESQRSAGEQLRVERERQGLSIEVLSSIIKVVPAKIQALEAGDLTALIKADGTETVCTLLGVARLFEPDVRIELEATAVA